jgi:flagellar assembly protein FliH
MAARFQFDSWFNDEGERAVAGAAALPRRQPPHQSVAARFDFPWLGQSGETEAAGPGGAPPPRTFSEAELEAALAAARAESAAATEARVRAELEAGMAARHAAALERIAAGFHAHQLALDRTIAARASASRDLALALAWALVPRALERQPLADVEAMLRDLLIRLEGEPRLTLALPPALVEAGRQLALGLAVEAGYRGELVVEADARLGPGDARLSWPGGDAQRDLVSLEREALAVVDAWLPETAADCQAARTVGAMP